MHNIIEEKHQQKQSLATNIASGVIRKFRQRNSNFSLDFDTKTIAKGIVVEIEFKKKFSGKTIIVKDRGRILNFSNEISRKYDKIALEDPVFEKKFEVYGTDQITSRTILTPSFMQRILDLSEHFKDAPIEACFYENNLFLFIQRKDNLFDRQCLISKKDLKKHLSQTITETNDIFQIIDILKLDKKIVI